jgi:uncharacterized protein YecT (DUF1311 family)
MKRPKPMVLAGIAAALLLLIVAIVLLARGSDGQQDRLADDQGASESAEGPEARCASQRTYDAIKRELFRQAARVRGSDQAAFERIAFHSAVRMERPVVRSADPDLGTVGCGGLLTLDLPPGVAVVGGRRSLSADVGYIVQRAADGSGDVVMLDGADPIIVPLATLARTGSRVPAPEPAVPPLEDAIDGLNETSPAETERQQRTTSPPVAPVPADEPERQSGPTANPSFNCVNASTRSEIRVCNNAELAALDRQMSAQFFRALANADEPQRELLQRTRSRFLSFRNACRSDDCIAGTYRGRMREIRDIMAGRWRAPS